MNLLERIGIRALVVGLTVLVIAVPVTLRTLGIVPGAFGVGVTILLTGVVVAILFIVLASPIAAVTMFLCVSFFRLALPVVALPIQPYTVAFFVVLGSAGIVLVWPFRRKLPFGAAEAAMALYLAWNIFSAVVPHAYPATVPIGDAAFSVSHFILTGTLVPFGIYAVGRYCFADEAVVRRLLWTIEALTVYSIAVSILQFTGPRALVWPKFIVDDPEWPDRAVGVFDQPVVNGLILIVGFVIALHLSHQYRPGTWQRWATYAIAGTSIAAIFLTHTRAVWLTFTLVLVLGAILMPAVRTAFLVLIAAGTLLIAFHWSSFTSADRAAGGVGSSVETEDRLNSITTSIWAVRERPLDGWGIGRFTQVNTYHHRQWSPTINWRRGYGGSSHENELGIATELGVVGLALWLAVLALVFRRLAQALRTLPSKGLCGRGLALVALFGFLVWFVMGLTVDLRFLDFANLVVMLLVGIAVGFGDRLHLEPPDRERSSIPIRRDVCAC